MNSTVKHILVCSDQYPTENDPVYPFVEQFVNAVASLGIRVSVVAPQSLTKHFFRKTKLHPVFRKIKKKNSVIVDVYQPYMITLGSRFPKINRFFQKYAINRSLRKLPEKPDVCYGHFWRCAYNLYEFACKNNLPLFVASGEAEIAKETNIPYADLRPFLDYYSGLICVSSKNKAESIKLGYLTSQKNIVAPNAIDSEIFYCKNKGDLRRKYGYSQNLFIVAFVGNFINRKGPQRVAEAVKEIGKKNIGVFFIGKKRDSIGIDPECPGILYKGVVEHEKLIDYLNMADVFVLPTLAEGCCNAIVEAMACGLPIISSNLPFNDDILNEKNSIRINPESIEEIKQAINFLYADSGKRIEMGENATLKSKEMTIGKRAKTILNFLNECVGYRKCY